MENLVDNVENVMDELDDLEARVNGLLESYPEHEDTLSYVLELISDAKEAVNEINDIVCEAADE